MLAWAEHYPTFGCKLASVRAAQSTTGKNGACPYGTAGSSMASSPAGEWEQPCPFQTSSVLSWLLLPQYLETDLALAT